MSVLPPRQLIAAVRAAEGDAGLKDLAPIALSARLLDGFTPDSDDALLRRSMIVEPVIHPVLAALLTVAGATRRGQLTFSVGLKAKKAPAVLNTLLDHCHPDEVLVADHACTALGRLRDVDSLRGWYNANALNQMLTTTPLPTLSRERHTRMHTAALYPGYGVVLISRDANNLYFKFHTHELECPDLEHVPLDLRPVGRTQRDPRPVCAVEAISALEWAASNGLVVVDPSDSGDVAVLRRRLVETLVAWPMPGRPARSAVSVGIKHAAATHAANVPASGHGSWEHITEQHCECAVCSRARVHASIRLDMTADDISKLERRWKGKVVVDPAVADVAALAAAVPVDDDRLRPYQREVVGMHLATCLGFVNALSPGMGKTICVLDALRRRAARMADTHTPWRGLVVVEANVRRQWANESTAWFPEATVVTVESAKDVTDLTEALATDAPVLALCSYALVSAVDDLPDVLDPADLASFSLAGVLDATHWHDLIADEAACLRNVSSKQSSALWRLRAHADVAIALTGTPITRSLDDVGRLVAWCRNDADLFTGHRLEKTIDVSTESGLREWTDALGPLLVRRDKTEIAAELPGLNATVVRLTPSAAERSLAHAARNELRRVYDELVAATNRAAKLDPKNPKWDDARDALVVARGAWLGGTQLARMSASDPAALLDSDSAGAALLAAQGLIDAACAETGTKRAWAVETIAAQVESGRQVLVFTEFASVARGLLDDLATADVLAGGVLGGGGRKRDDNIAAFTAGELSVLVSTSSGERGLNLQCADVVIHYDLPWTPDAVLQRTGRVERIGATSDEIEVMFPVMAETIEERVAALVVSRAAAAMQALDVSRGIDAKETDMGRALGALVKDADATSLNVKEASLLDITKALLAA